MFDLKTMLKQSDGYHILTVHSDDKEVRAAVIAGMEYKGYRQYSMSAQQDGSVQYGFVTQAFYEVLNQRHMESCRNSMGSSMALLQDKGVLGRAWDRIRGRSLRTPEERKRDFLVHGTTGQPPAVDELTLARQRALDDDGDLVTLAALTIGTNYRAPEVPGRDYIAPGIFEERSDLPVNVDIPDHDVFSGDRHPPRRDVESITEVEKPEVRVIRELNMTTSRPEVDTFMRPAEVSHRPRESYHHHTPTPDFDTSSVRESYPSRDPDPSPSDSYSDNNSTSD